MAQVNDSHIVVPVEDGNGHGFHVTLPVPKIKGTDAEQATFMVGYKYEATRSLQSIAKKAAKAGQDVKAALAAAAASLKIEPNPERVETVGSLRTRLASEMLEAHLKAKNLPSNEATVKAHLAAYITKRAKEVEARLDGYLSAGYTPKARGTGGTATPETSAAISDADL